MDRVVFRSAESADLDGLIALAEECPGAPCWALGTWRLVLDSVPKGERNVLVALWEERLVGFGVAGIADDIAEIESLAVTAAMRGRGIGGELCEMLMSWAGTRGAARMLLEVRVSNDAARALYESLGFHEVAIRSGYYREPAEDGLTMVRAVQPKAPDA